jgi:hypothetical protein
MRQFETDTFNRAYSASPLEFSEAESPHFKCRYAHREADTVLHFSPTILPTRSDFTAILTKCLPPLIGEDRAEKSTVEIVKDELLDRGESVYVSIPEFTMHTLRASKMLVEKFLTAAHEGLS